MTAATLQTALEQGRHAPGEGRPKGRRRLSGWWLLLAPILAFDVVLFLTPLGKLVASSFADNAYQRVL
jgi:putative spermidine/putrescine transport system permease protein